METKKRRPNFLVFVTDQLQSFSLGCNGNEEVKTPNIDQLAENGCTFRRAYCNNSVCMPSRSTMITGLTPRQHGCLTNGTILPENVPTITRALVNHEYRTHSVGKVHLQPFMGNQARDDNGKRSFSWEDSQRWNSGEITGLPEMYYGFQTSDFVGGHVSNCFGDYSNWLKANGHLDIHEKYQRRSAYWKSDSAPGCWRMDMPPELHYNNWIADRSIAFLDSFGTDENFFLWCSFPDPHAPFAACKPYSDMYDPSSLALNPTCEHGIDDLPHLAEQRKRHGQSFDKAALREITAQTYGMITHVDDNIGRVMAHLKGKDLIDNTIIVFMADHGEYLGTHHLLLKAVWPWEELLRVPFIWKVPDAFASGKGTDHIASLLDFAPTILDYAGIDQDELDFRGQRQGERLGLPGQSLRGFLSAGELLEKKPAIMEYDEDWHAAPTYRTRTIIDERYKMTIYPNTGGGILSDLGSDPHETKNLWDDPDYATVKAKLMESLLFELVRTDRMDQPRLCGA